MQRLMTCLVLGLALLAAPVYAAEADEENFVRLHAALAIDAQCGVFKRFERVVLAANAFTYTEDMSINSNWQSGKIDDVEYDARIASLQAEAKALAGSMGCTQAAAPLVSWARNLATPEIYKYLMIAFERELAPELAQSAQAYEAMVAPLYGENWPQLVAYTREQAQKLVNDAKVEDSSAYGAGLFGTDFGFGLGDYSAVESALISTYNVDNLYNGALWTLNRVFFEVTVERLGMRVRTFGEAPEDGASLIDAQGNRLTDIWQSGETYLLAEDEMPVHAMVSIDDDGAIRVMTFGPGAERMTEGSVVFMHPSGPMPDAFSDEYTYYKSIDWRQNATVYEASLVEEACLGGPCFRFGPELSSALVAAGPHRWAQIVFRSDAGTPLPPHDKPTLVLKSQLARELIRREETLGTR